MRRPRRDPWPAAPEFELIVRFGGAEIVRDLSCRLHLRGGTEADRAEARAWAAQFLSDAKLHEERPVRVIILPRPECPPPPQRQ